LPGITEKEDPSAKEGGSVTGHEVRSVKGNRGESERRLIPHGDSPAKGRASGFRRKKKKKESSSHEPRRTLVGKKGGGGFSAVPAIDRGNVHSEKKASLDEKKKEKCDVFRFLRRGD